MSEQRKGKKRPKSYYRKCAAGGKKARQARIISAGMKGFLVTCNKYEKETVREMYNLLNEYADVMYGPELDTVKTKLSEGSESDSDEEDMEKAMARETSVIKQANAAERRFQNTETKCNNVIFIRTTVEDPCRLAHEIFRDSQEKQVQKVRYAIRMLPVAAVCGPVSKDIENTLRDVLAPHFETEFGVGIKYTAVCKIRNNNSVSKNTVLPLLGKIIKEMNPQHQLCHDEPDLVIIVEVVQKACCFSVVKDYFRFKKYNLHEIVKKSTEEETINIEDETRGKKEDEIVDSPDTKKDENGEEIADNLDAKEGENGEEIVDDLNTKENEEVEGKEKTNEVENLENTDKTNDKEHFEGSCNVQTVGSPTDQESTEVTDERKDEVESCKSSDKEMSETSDKTNSIESKNDKIDQTVVIID